MKISNARFVLLSLVVVAQGRHKRSLSFVVLLVLPYISLATLPRQEAVHACCRSHFTEGINVATVLFKQSAASRSIIMPIDESPEKLLRFELVTVDHMARSVAMVECSELRRCVHECNTIRGCLQVPATWQCICNRVRP